MILLLPTQVPDGLELERLDVESVFGAAHVAAAERYERFLLIDWVLSQVVLLAVLAVYARRGIAFVRESAAGPIGTGMLLGMVGLGIAWLATLPFRVAAHWWDRRHDLTTLDYVSWLFQDGAVLAAEFLAVCFALVVVMGLARTLGERWWLPGAAIFVAIAAFFLFVFSYLDLGATRPVRDPALLLAAERYEQKLELPDIPLRVERVSDDTTQANAYAIGIGPSRRVVFWDTLLAKPFSPAEQKAVLAHELAHHSRDHLPKGIGWFAIFAVPGTWILMRLTRRRGGMGRPEAVPLALVVVAAVQLASAPAQNWISRRQEAEADWVALEMTRDPSSLERLMVHFSRTSLGDPDPPAWTMVFLRTHPTYAERVAIARAWTARRHQAGP